MGETVIAIIELQTQIWDLRKKTATQTISDHMKVLQNRLDSLISGMNDRDNQGTKLMLNIMTLQSQVEHLQRQLSNTQMLGVTQVTQLRNELTTKRQKLQKFVRELKENNQSNAQLILTVIALYNQLRNLEVERSNYNGVSSLTITKLKDKLKEKT